MKIELRPSIRNKFVIWLLAIALVCVGALLLSVYVFNTLEEDHLRWEREHADSHTPTLAVPKLSDIEKIQSQETVRQTAEDPLPTFRTLPSDTYPQILEIMAHAIYDPNVAGSRFPPLIVTTKDQRELRFQFGVSEGKRMFVCEGDNCFRTQLTLDEFRKLMAAPGEHDE